ncbi:hypothetical protein BG004_000615 [Podila humilis]|nr:hypothetical protein BG004_000615 [Podila humilis]
MRFSIVAIVASVVAVVAAQEAPLNPLYPFKPDGPCVKACNEEAGKSLFPEYTEDPASPKFLESMSYGHEKGTPKYTAYMGKAGMCMGKCPQEEQNLMRQQFNAKAAWYAEKKAAAEAAAAADAASKSGAAGSAAVSGIASVVAVAVAAALF